MSFAPKPPGGMVDAILVLKLFMFASADDRGLLGLGAVAAVATGVAQPVTSIFFGRMIEAFSKFQAKQINGNKFQAIVNANTLNFVCLALAVFVTTYTFMACYMYVSSRQTFQIWNNYLKAVLQQESGWFDGLGAGKLATRITSNTSLIQDGILEKVALIIQDISTFLLGFAIAFTASWQLTLVVLCIIPAMAITIGFLNYFASHFATQSIAHYSNAGTLVEEAISSMRTAMAFNQQHMLEKLYSSRMLQEEHADLCKAFAVGVGVSCIFFFIYCGYSLAFYYGSSLIIDGLIGPGTVVNVFFAMLIGAFLLSNVAPNLQTLSIAKGAGAKIFQAIDQTPKIDGYTTGSKQPAVVNGHIAFKNITFS
ncbi:hypothetical protein DSO57_1018993 [Entomophthora muscae]|uniref:Uncharacterized protein n=1 Tax=Entomophthora muscae TaxID=34485 RepID=A0ACC2RIX3_9FUNG|nr:hypothetical protein DSO57_1018993 [Entomophthora muscae]